MKRKGGRKQEPQGSRSHDSEGRGRALSDSKRQSKDK